MQNRVAQQGSEWVIDWIWPFQVSVAEAELARLRRHMNLKRAFACLPSSRAGLVFERNANETKERTP